MRKVKPLSGLLSAICFLVVIPPLIAQGNGYFPRGNCQYLVNTGGCDVDPPYMEQNCQYSCETTKATKPPPPDPCANGPPKTDCLNENPCCEKWIRENEGICKKNKAVKKACRYACGECQRKNCPGCFDLSEKCEEKKNKGKCGTDWMAENCRQSCGLCYENKEANCGHPIKRFAPDLTSALEQDDMTELKALLTPVKRYVSVYYTESIIAQNPCENQMGEFALCMDEHYGQYSFNPNRNIPFEKYECQLKKCLRSCRRSELTVGCDKDFDADVTVRDDRLKGKVETGSGVNIDLSAIKASKTKALDCGLETVTKLLQPKIEECVRDKLDLNGGFRLQMLNLHEFLQLEQQSTPRAIQAHSFELNSLASDLMDEASLVCATSEAKRAKECIFENLEDITHEIGNPTLRAYQEQQRYCKNRGLCTSSLKAACMELNAKILIATAECTTKWAKKLKFQLIDDYLECLAKQGFPRAVADLNRDPTVARQLSETYDESLEKMNSFIGEAGEDPCKTKLFPTDGWDTVKFLNFESKHTVVCQRSPRLTPSELKSGGRTKRESANRVERAVKDDVCQDSSKYLSVASAPDDIATIMQERLKRNSQINSPDYSPLRPEGSDVLEPLQKTLAKTASGAAIDPKFAAKKGRGNAKKPKPNA